MTNMYTYRVYPDGSIIDMNDIMGNYTDEEMKFFGDDYEVYNLPEELIEFLVETWVL